jgi:amino acid transporter
MEGSPPKNTLGFWATAAIGIGGMVGGGVFAVFGIAAVIAKGGVPIAFLVAGLIALLTSYSYAKLSLRFPSSGGTVTFMNEAFGSGVLSGGFNLLLCLSYIIMLAVYAHAFANYALEFFPKADPVSWGYVIRSGVVVLLTLLNALSPQFVVKSELWTDLAKILLLLFFIAAGLESVDVRRLSPTTWPPLFEMLAGGMTLFLCYEGFELIANASKEVRNPRKNLPRAFYSSIVFVILLYLAISIVVMGNLPLTEIEKNSGSVLAESAKPFLGDFGFTLIAITALLAAGSAINATLYGSAQITSLLARRGQLLQELEPTRHHRPVAGLLLMSALTLLAANFLNLASVSTLGSAGFLLIFAAVNGANFRLRGETRSRKYLPLLGMLACLSALILMLSFAWKQSPHHVWELIGMLGLVFLFEAIYQKISGRRRLARESPH